LLINVSVLGLLGTIAYQSNTLVFPPRRHAGSHPQPVLSVVKIQVREQAITLARRWFILM